MVPKWCNNPEKWEEGPTPLRARVYMGDKKYAFGYLVPEGETAIITDAGAIVSYIEKADLSLEINKRY